MNADQFQREMPRELHEEMLRRLATMKIGEVSPPNPPLRIQFAEDEACVSTAMLKGLLLLGIMFAVGFAVGWMVR